MNSYQAKFEREAKDRPTDWVIVWRQGKYKLVYVGNSDETKIYR